MERYHVMHSVRPKSNTVNLCCKCDWGLWKDHFQSGSNYSLVKHRLFENLFGMKICFINGSTTISKEYLYKN